MSGGLGSPAALPSGNSNPTRHSAFNRKKNKDESPGRAVSGTLFRSFRRTFGRTCFLDASALELGGFVARQETRKALTMLDALLQTHKSPPTVYRDLAAS